MIELYEYQTKYLATVPARGIMAAATGTGKSFMSLAHYEAHGEGLPLLILAPASKVRTGDWERDVALWWRGREASAPHFEVWSYEKFSRNPSLKEFKNGKRAIWHNAAPHYGGRDYAVIADEVHKAKNPQSGVGKALYWAAKDTPFFIGLSATALPNGWIDFANYSKIFGFTKNITEFKKKYCQIQTFKGFPEIVGYWREDELRRQWSGIARELTKEQAHDLPPRQFVAVDFKRPAQYVKTIMERKAPDGTLLDTPSALAHALRQTLTSPKLEYLSDIVEGTTDNLVIFYNYESEREAILDMLAKKHKGKVIFEQNGHKHEIPLKDEWDKVHNSVTLAHYKSGGTGVEMQYASITVYFSPTYSYAEYIQSIGRTYRNGQQSHTTFYNFRTPHTIEEDIYRVLKTKNNFQDTQWEAR